MENAMDGFYNKNLEDALKASKETNLNGLNILQVRNQKEVISVGDIEISLAEVCHLCGKILPPRIDFEFVSGHGLTESIQDNNCKCPILTDCFTEDMEMSHKRDSGFHTLKREESEKVDTGQQAESTLSSASSADSAVSITSNDVMEYVKDAPGSRQSLPSIVVDECNQVTIEGGTFQFTEKEIVSQEKKKLGASVMAKKESPKACAEKLFNFHGYKRSEVAKMIGKNTEYSRQVGHEYLKFFEFSSCSLIDAYRDFLSRFALLGETQERERILSYFSQRYIACNPDFLNQKPDSVHTLVCAMTLLNTDLHGNVGLGSGRKKMTYKQFAANLSGLMSDESDYPSDLLILLYSSVKKHPLPWGGKEQRKAPRSSSMRQNTQPISITSPTKIVNRSLSTRSPIKFKSSSVDSSRAGLGRTAKPKPLSHNQGLLWRKAFFDSDGKKVSMGKRGWKVYSVALQNLELHVVKRGSTEVKSISLHHCLAEESSSDSKRQHVFRITLADSSVTLYQASSEKESRKWIRDFNKAAALFSAAPLCSPVGSQLVFRKALLPSAPSTLPPANQLGKLQELLNEHETDLVETEKVAETEESTSEQTAQYYEDKISYLKSEIKKYEHYVKILQIHLRANSLGDDSKSNLEGSDNGSLISVTPSEPPLASPSPMNSADNFVFSEHRNSEPASDNVFSSPAHLLSPQHRTLTLSPTSSLPNLSPILESPSNGPFAVYNNNNNLGSLRRRQRKELYESSLNDAISNGDVRATQNVNNSNHVSTPQRASDTSTVPMPHQSESSTVSVSEAENHLVVRNHLWKHGRHSPMIGSSNKTNSATVSPHSVSANGVKGQTFPVKRFEMRIADMESQQSVTPVHQHDKIISSWSSFTDSVPRQNQLNQPFENLTLSRVKGRREKKGIERYSYMQAISPPEES